MTTDALTPSRETTPYWQRRHEIPGVFEDIDFLLFDYMLSEQSALGIRGDALEIGAFNGKSAIVIGSHVAPPDRFVICDVFEDEGSDEANTRENSRSYAGLTRDRFLANYRKYVQDEPVIVQQFSSEIRSHVPDRSLRFAHIDGGHLFDVVQDDLNNMRSAIGDDGIVVLDDYRAFHTPGVAAAVWQEVGDGGLIPICLTDAKFYGTWSDSAAARATRSLEGWLSARGTIRTGVQQLAGHSVRLVQNPRIWTTRRAIKAAIPPVISEKLLRRPDSFLGG